MMMHLLPFVGNTNFSVLTHAFKISYLQLQFEEEDDEHEVIRLLL